MSIFDQTFMEKTGMKADTLVIKKLNEVHLTIDAEPVIRKELIDFFSFLIPNAKFHPKVRSGWWDGRINLYHGANKTLYTGLIDHITAFANERDYKVEMHYKRCFDNEITYEQAEEFANSLEAPFTPAKHQIQGFHSLITDERGVLVSPTASGKSFIIKMMIDWYGDKSHLIIVPTKNLVYQMRQDLIDYGTDPDEIQVVMGGETKVITKRITISTWQSIFKMPHDFFKAFEVVHGDECHLYEAKSLVGILEKMTDCHYRFGYTGTLDEDAKTNKLVLQGLFGKTRQFIDTMGLVDIGFASEFTVQCLTLRHHLNDRKKMRNADYQEELRYLNSHGPRNRFLAKLCLSCEGNTLILFERVESHLEVVHKLLKEMAPSDRPVYLIHGGVDAEEREKIRLITEKETNAIIAASYGTFSTGNNVRNLHNLVRGSANKSRIWNLQSLGRILRKSPDGRNAKLFDVGDDIRTGQKANHTLRHFAKRVQIYNAEGFSYEIFNLDIKENDQ